MYILAHLLGIHNVICLFSALLTERKVLLVSQSYNRLADSAHALISLLYPLKFW